MGAVPGAVMMRPRLRRLFLYSLVIGIVAAVGGVWASRPRDPDRVFLRARTDLAAGRTGDASAALVELERLRAPTPFDRLLRAQVAEAIQRPADALAELAFIPDESPLAPVARSLTGKIELGRGRLRAAESAYLAAVTLKPESVQPRRDLVYIYNLQHRQADLDAQLHALSELETLDFQYLLHWGKTRNVVWNPERDTEALRKCVEADPTDRRSRLALSEGLRRLDRLEEAEASIASLPDSDPDTRAQRAVLMMERGDREAVDKLLAGGGDHPVLAQLRGQVALTDGDPGAAARHYAIAVAADPTDRSANFGLGSALRAAGNLAEAERYLERVRRYDALTPLISKASTAAGAADPALPAQLAAACEAAGRILEARAWYKLVIGRDPLDPEPQRAFYRLGLEIARRSAQGDAAATATRSPRADIPPGRPEG
jgi:tetratricopeptide (TPR) repeat protein